MSEKERAAQLLSEEMGLKVTADDVDSVTFTEPLTAVITLKDGREFKPSGLFATWLRKGKP